MRASVYIATSLDGFIARPDGSVGWLMAASEGSHDGEDYGYQAFFDSIDCMILGRKSMEMVLSFGVDWPYEGKRVIVLSRTLNEPPETLVGKVEIYDGSLSDLMQTLESEGHQRAYVDGGKTIQSFLNEGLLSDMVITCIPILIGEGLPLFGPTPADIHLTHVRTQSYPSGFVQSEYTI